MVLPVGEEADAVAAEEDLVEVVLEVVEGEIFVDGSARPERWAGR